jgi:hypothetical protein
MLYRPFYRHKLPIYFLIKPNKEPIARQKKMPSGETTQNRSRIIINKAVDLSFETTY